MLASLVTSGFLIKLGEGLKVEEVEVFKGVWYFALESHSFCYSLDCLEGNE